MFDIKSLAILATSDFKVRDAAGELQKDADGNQLTITLYSPGTQKFVNAKHAYDEKVNSRNFARISGKADGKMSAEEINDEMADFLAKVTKSFNFFGYGEEQGEALFKSVYADIEIGHISDGVNKFLGDRGNFKKPSAEA